MAVKSGVLHKQSRAWCAVSGAAAARLGTALARTVGRRADRDAVCLEPDSANDDRARRHGLAKCGELFKTMRVVFCQA